MKLYEPQPASLIYAFDKGWRVISFVWTHIFAKTDITARWWFSKGSDFKLRAQYQVNKVLKFWLWTLVIGCYVAGFFQYISAMAIVVIFMFLQFILLIVWASISGILMALLSGFNYIYGNVNKIFFRCPDCHAHMMIPIYICPRCATEHSRLWPSVYGVFHHKCEKCQIQLPTLDVLGRKDIIRRCPTCKTPMNKDIGRMINVHIPVIGGPSAGKSNYIIMATNQFIENYANTHGIKVSFPDEKHELDYQSNVKRLSSGTELVKTTNIVPQAYNLAIKKPRDMIGRIVYIYDAAGEAYSDERNTVLQTYFRYIHGLIFIIDPFSIEQFVQEHEAEIEKIKGSIRPSSLNVMSAYERMMNVIESSVKFTRNKKIGIPIAVIVLKTDALDLEDRIGRPAASRIMLTDPLISSEEDAINTLVDKFLIENGLGNFVRDLQAQFEKVRYYSCSALGRLPDPVNRTPYEPIGVLDPFLWLLGEIGVINMRSERSRNADSAHKSAIPSGMNIFQKAKFYFWDSLLPPKK
jgi:hypothetical protein